ncbi:DUF6221 family protein, partial [Arthrobacter sp. AL12]|uniref:DUF6221 family protein n=1 Tax=Arthrobacter sp. AL12 TaxID=3042241 RepID=UPI00249AB011
GNERESGHSGDNAADLRKSPKGFRWVSQERAIIAGWKEAADAEGISDPSEAEGTVAIARRAMLTILAGSHREHPNYEQCWIPGLPTDLASESAKD